MKLKNMIFASLLVACMVPGIASADLIVREIITGSIVEGDFFADDGDGTFYYDLHEYTATSTDRIHIVIDTPAFAGYVGWGTNLGLPEWEGGMAPYDDFSGDGCNGSPGEFSIFINNPTVGQSYQIFLSSCFYVEDAEADPAISAFGDYTITILTDTEVVGVSEPGTLALLGLGLVGMAMTRRRKKI